MGFKLLVPGLGGWVFWEEAEVVAEVALGHGDCPGGGGGEAGLVEAIGFGVLACGEVLEGEGTVFLKGERLEPPGS